MELGMDLLGLLEQSSGNSSGGSVVPEGVSSTPIFPFYSLGMSQSSLGSHFPVPNVSLSTWGVSYPNSLSGGFVLLWLLFKSSIQWEFLPKVLQPCSSSDFIQVDVFPVPLREGMEYFHWEPAQGIFKGLYTL